jgi:hypothetical protein
MEMEADGDWCNQASVQGTKTQVISGFRLCVITAEGRGEGGREAVGPSFERYYRTTLQNNND